MSAGFGSVDGELFRVVDHHPANQFVRRDLQVVPQHPVSGEHRYGILGGHAAHPVLLQLIQFQQHPETELFNTELWRSV